MARKKEIRFTRFMKDELNIVRSLVEQALDPLAERHNLVVKAGNIKYDDFELTMVLNVQIKNDASGNLIDVPREDYKKWASNYGLNPEWLDKTFTAHGETYKISGLYPNRRRMPVRVIRLRDNADRICKVSMVKTAFLDPPKRTPTVPISGIEGVINSMVKA